MTGQNRIRPKSNLNSISGCGFRSIWDLYYPNIASLLHVRVRGDGRIDLAGLQTMCVPQGVVGCRLV